MSALSDALGSALSALSTFKGEALTYATTFAGSYSTLAGWFLHRDRVQRDIFADQVDAQKQEQTATLKGPLTPALAAGYFINDANSQKWVVESVMKDQQQICAVRRVTSKSLGPDRGATR